MRYVLPYARIAITLGLSAGNDADPVTRTLADIIQVIRFLIYPTPVVESWYLEKYPDVAQSLSRHRIFESPTQHFVTTGYFEGRLPSPPGPENPKPQGFAKLKSNFSIIPARSAIMVSFSRADLVSMIRSAIACVPVDDQFYLEKYKEVAASVEAGHWQSAREHYQACGYFENRLPYDLALDRVWYTQAYPDIASAAAGDPNFDATWHFESGGYKEGRWPRGDALLWLTEPKP